MRLGVVRFPLTVLAAVSVLAGCTGSTAPSSVGIAPAVASAVTATAPAATGSSAPLPSAIAYAIHQRQLFGLRADEAWVEQVAADPTATFLLDFPMTPAEATAFDARQASFDEVAAAVQAYAPTVAGQYGGGYIDNAAGKVVALFTSDPEKHRLAILARLGKDAPLVTRQVSYTEAALRALQERVMSDRAWLPKNAALQSVGVDTIKNRTFVELSSADPTVPALVVAHYGVPADEIEVTIDGTGAALIPQGTIDLTVDLGKGAKTPTTGFDLGFTGDGPGSCGGMTGWAVMPGVAVNVPCQAGSWTVSLLDDTRQAVASGNVTVVGGEHVKLVISVP